MSKKALSKLTMKACGAKPDFDAIYAAKPNPVPLLRVVGIAAKAIPDATEQGPFLRFKGRFQATNLRTGAEFFAGSAILPKVAEELLGGALEAVDSGSSPQVSFGFDISARYDETAITKYVYEIVPLMQPQEDDPLAMLAKSVAATAPLPSLPAPAADPAPTGGPAGDVPDPAGDDPAPASNGKGGKGGKGGKK